MGRNTAPTWLSVTFLLPTALGIAPTPFEVVEDHGFRSMVGRGDG